MVRAAARVVLLLGFWSVVLVSTTSAADWSAKGNFGVSLEASDNRSLVPNSPGETYVAATHLMLSTIARLPGFQFEAAGDVSYRNLSGPGDDGSEDPINYGGRFRVEKLDKLTKYFLAGAWRHEDAVTAQLADSGVVLVNGDITTYTMDAGFLRQVSPLDTFKWSIGGRAVDLTSPVAAPYVDVLMTNAWTRKLTRRTEFTGVLELEMLARDDVANTNTYFARALAGLTHEVSKQLKICGAVGAGMHHTTRDAVLLPLPEPTETSASWLADFNVSYRPGPSTEITFSAIRSIQPSTIGEVQNRTTVSLALRQALNHSSYLLLLGEFNRVSSLDGLDYDDADLWRASVTYGYRFTPEWSAHLTYRYAERMDDNGLAHSNTFLFSAVRDFVILP